MLLYCIATLCCISFYALKTLKAHGLQGPSVRHTPVDYSGDTALFEVTHDGVSIVHLFYASPA